MIENSTMFQPWPQWQKILFRFFFIYFGLYILSFSFSDFGEWLIYVASLQTAVVDWMVYGFNDYILHFKDQLVPLAGSGDTSYGWVQVILYLCLAAIGTVIWTLLDNKRNNYRRLDYILWNSIRYFVCFIAFTYGSIKVFMMQMSFPSLSQLATPLGDFLPMRFTWMYIGYSDGYQFFSGLMEMVVFVLLLFRRTVLLGLCVGLGVFINVMMLNLCYDVPVKLFSIHLVAMCLFLLVPDLKRILNFFLFNKSTQISAKYHFTTSKKWMRASRIVLKSIFIFLLGISLLQIYEYATEKSGEPFAYGVYDIDSMIVGNDTVPILANDSLAWKDMIFDKWSTISVNSTDTLFSQSYRRGYFYYQRDSIKQTLTCYKYNENDSVYLFTMRYNFEGKDKLKLNTKIKNDSVTINLTNNHRKFQLQRKEFHWLSENNR